MLSICKHKTDSIILIQEAMLTVVQLAQTHACMYMYMYRDLPVTHTCMYMYRDLPVTHTCTYMYRDLPVKADEVRMVGVHVGQLNIHQ